MEFKFQKGQKVWYKGKPCTIEYQVKGSEPRYDLARTEPTNYEDHFPLGVKERDLESLSPEEAAAQKLIYSDMWLAFANMVAYMPASHRPKFSHTMTDLAGPEFNAQAAEFFKKLGINVAEIVK